MGIITNDIEVPSVLPSVIQDLVNLSCLSATWSGLDSTGVIKDLAKVLLKTLALDLVYVRLVNPADSLYVETLGSKDHLDAGGSISGSDALVSFLNKVPIGGVVVVDPFGSRSLRATATQLDASDPKSILVAASYRIDFPTEQDRLLLGVAANQVAVVLQRQQAEQALKESQEHLRAVFDSAGDGLYVMGADTLCTYLNPIGAAMLGYEVEELVGRPLHNIIHHTYSDGRHHPVLECPIFLASSEGIPSRVDDDVFWRKDGTPVPVTYSVAPTMVDGRPSGAVVTYRDISERKQAEADQERLLRRVEAERELLADVFQRSPSFMCVLSGRDHVFERANAQYHQLVGQRDILGKPVREALPEVVEQGFVALLDRVFTSGDPHIGTDVPVLLQRSEGGPTEQRYMNFVFQALRSPEGEIAGIFVQGIDLTERKQAEEALARVSAESNRRRRLYETILANTPDLAYVFDLNHRFTYANEVLLQMWGQTWESAIGKNCLELGYEPWHAEMHDREIERVISTKQPVRGQVPFAGTFGPRIYDYILVPVLGPDGEVEAVAGTTRDITELKQSEGKMATLLASEKQRAAILTQIANASRTMSVVLSMDSIAAILTEEARTMLGAHQAVASLSLSDDWAQAINAVSLSEKYAKYRSYSPKPDGSGIYAEVCRTNRPMRLTQQELEAHPAWKGFGKHAKDHPLMRGWLAVPLVGQGGKNLGLVQLSDKYEGEFNEQDEAILMQLAAIAATGIENARLYEQVRVQDRRKDEFLATLAHELRNPLAPIRTGLTLLKAAPSIEATVKTREIMERQVSHMVDLIDDLLDVSRITSGKIQLKKERIDLCTLLDAALELSRPLIEENRHQIALSTPIEPLMLDADPTRIAQIVSNILNNAAKYTPTGGRIELSAGREAEDAVIRVTDNGVGLTPDALPKVFELFSQVGKTLDRAQGGLGIGLALVKRLVEMHNGQVTAESPGPGQGSTFTIRLPLAPAGMPHTHPVLGSSEALPLANPRRILVVDDNVDAAELLSMLLGFAGHAVETVYTGPDALKAARATRPDVIFLDIGLPGMCGYEVANQLRSDPSMNDVVLVALTGWGTEEDRRRTQEAGFDGHLTKPVQLDKLEEWIANPVSNRL